MYNLLLILIYNENLMYDDEYHYIVKGSNGTYELIQEISDLSKSLRDEGIIFMS